MQGDPVDALNMPPPIDVELRTLPSPVPTQMMSGLSWLMATAPIEATG